MHMADVTHSSVDKLIIRFARMSKVFMLIDNRSIFIDMCGGDGGGLLIQIINLVIMVPSVITTLLL